MKYNKDQIGTFTSKLNARLSVKPDYHHDLNYIRLLCDKKGCKIREKS